MRVRPRIKWGKIILMVVGSALLLIGMMAAVVIGVVNASFKYAPPSAEELKEDPSLVRYLDSDDVIVETYRK